MPRFLKLIVLASLTIAPIVMAYPAQAAYPDRATYDLITQRYNTFLEGQSRWPCAYYGNLETLSQDGNTRRMSVLYMRDQRPDHGGSVCNGIFDFLRLIVNCDAKTAYYSPFLGSPTDYDRQQRPTKNQPLIDYIFRFPIADPQGDYQPTRRTLATGEWEVVDADNTGLHCRNRPVYQDRDFHDSLNYTGDLLELLQRDPQGVGSWDVVTTLKRGTKLLPYGGPLGIHNIYRDTQNKTWLTVVIGDRQHYQSCFVRANQQYIRPVFQFAETTQR